MFDMLRPLIWIALLALPPLCGAAIPAFATRDEIKEVFLQTAIYCGVPAAVEAFRCAREVFEEDKKK